MFAIHDEQLAEHGGQAGVRDRGLLESAMARPRNQYACGEHAPVRLATSYAFGIPRNHPFLDGNKCVTTFLQIAAGDLTEDRLAEWLAAHCAQAR